ncbi:hypothetical protein ACWDBD_19470 [Streptomyces sp. NPDC001118]
MPSHVALTATAPEPSPDARCQEYLEQAAAAGLLDLDEPETLVITDVPQDDGSLFSCTAWAPGAARLGDHIDQASLASRLDACAWLEVLDRHARTTHHGQTVIRTYPLRHVLAEVEASHRGSENLRAAPRLPAGRRRGAGRPATAVGTRCPRMGQRLRTVTRTHHGDGRYGQGTQPPAPSTGPARRTRRSRRPRPDRLSGSTADGL